MLRLLRTILILALVGLAHAQAPSDSLSVSAILKDGVGNPLAGPVDIEFLIYDSPGGGMLLYSETQVGLPVSADGRVQANLGQTTPLTAAVFATPDRWLTMNVAGDGEMAPRMPLSTVPYAHNANLLDGSPPSTFAPRSDLNDGDPMSTPVGWTDLSAVPAGFSDGLDDVNDADSDPMNEIQDWLTLPGIPAGFADGIDDVNDADSDPSNELQSWATLPGIPAGFADGTDDVNDADSDPSNELQTWASLPGKPAGFADDVDNVGGITGSASTAGLGNAVTPSRTFLGPTLNVTVASGEEVFMVTSKAFGSTLGGGGYGLDIWPCYQLGAGAIQVAGGGIFGLTVPQNQRHTFTITAVFAGLAPGTYTVGMGGLSAVGSASWNNNEYGYISVLVFP